MISGPLALALVLAVAQAPAPPPDPAPPPAVASPDPTSEPAASPDPNTAPTGEPAASPDPDGAAPPPVLTPPPPVLLGPPQPSSGPGPAFTPVPIEQRPPPPRGNGLGLIIGAAIFGGLNVGLTAARFGLSLGEVDDRRENIRYWLTTVAMPIDVAAGVGLAAGGGHLRGRRDGYRSAYDGEPRLRATAFIQTGAVMLAIGAVGYVMAWIPWHGDSSLDGRGGGTLLVESVSSLVLMGGAGILVYGYSWRRHAERHGYSRRVALRPALAPGFTGVSLVGRF